MKSDDFANDWLGWGGNQSGHFCIGLASAVILEALGLPVWWQVVGIVVAYWLVIEVASQRLRLWRDAIMDTAFVAGGAVFMQAELATLLILGPLMAFGILQRIRRAGFGG